MPAANAVAATTALVQAATRKGNANYGATYTPAQWANLAGYHGSDASSVRAAIARQHGNGCGRTGRYPAVSAPDMLALLGHAVTVRQQPQAAPQVATANAKLWAASRAAAAKAKAQAQAS